MELLNTELGWLSRDNVIYLNNQGVLMRADNDSIGIANNKKIISGREVQVYSLFCWIKDDIMELLKFKDINDVVDVMRTGYENRYPMVDNIMKYGFRLYLQKQEKNKNDKVDLKDF